MKIQLGFSTKDFFWFDISDHIVIWFFIVLISGFYNSTVFFMKEQIENVQNDQWLDSVKIFLKSSLS